MRLVNLAPFEPKANWDLSNCFDVSILIKTLEREAHLVQLLESIQQFGFQGPIFIADDSFVPYGDRIIQFFPKLNLTYLKLPYDSGTAIGRNRMLELVDTTYFLLCDDDFVFDRRTRIPIMKRLMIKNDLDILGGVFRQHNKKSRKGKFLFLLNKLLNCFGWVLPSTQIYEYSAGINIESDSLSLFPVKYQNPVTFCDLTHNFFLAKTEKVKAFGGWNSILKGGEHQNFFIRAKLAGLRVGTTRLCGIVHDQWTINSKEYKVLRERGGYFKKKALEEFGFSTIENYKEVLGEDFFVN